MQLKGLKLITFGTTTLLLYNFILILLNEKQYKYKTCYILNVIFQQTKIQRNKEVFNNWEHFK